MSGSMFSVHGQKNDSVCTCSALYYRLPISAMKPSSIATTSIVGSTTLSSANDEKLQYKSERAKSMRAILSVRVMSEGDPTVQDTQVMNESSSVLQSCLEKCNSEEIHPAVRSGGFDKMVKLKLSPS